MNHAGWNPETEEAWSELLRRNCVICGLELDSLARCREICPESLNGYSHGAYATHRAALLDYERRTKTGDFAPWETMQAVTR